MDAPRKAAQSTDDRAAAYQEYNERTSKAWESDSDFNNALYVARVGGELRLLRDYIAAGKPIPEEQVLVAGKVVEMDVLVAELLGCQQLPEDQARPGRPNRVPSEAPPSDQAERNATWLVRFEQQSWRSNNHRKRVPGAVLNKMIKRAIQEAAKVFDVPHNTISDCNIRNLLKNGRIVVR